MKKNILCIDRNKSILFVIKTLLKDKFNVQIFEDSYQAMRPITTEQSIDLILLSIESLEDDNIELLYHLGSSSMLRNIPVIILSSRKYDELKDVCLESNVHSFFTKPFNPLELSEKINQTISTTNESQILFKKRKIFNLN